MSNAAILAMFQFLGCVTAGACFGVYGSSAALGFGVFAATYALSPTIQE